MNIVFTQQGTDRVFNYPNKDGTFAMLDDISTTLTLASNSTVSTTTNVDVSGMSFTALANTDYEIEVLGSFQTIATTTGIGISLDIPSGSVNGFVIAPSANTTSMISIQRSDDATVAPTTGVGAANTVFPLWGKYLVKIGATGGTVQLRQRSEVAASNSIIMAGTIMKYRVI